MPLKLCQTPDSCHLQSKLEDLSLIWCTCRVIDSWRYVLIFLNGTLKNSCSCGSHLLQSLRAMTQMRLVLKSSCLHAIFSLYLTDFPICVCLMCAITVQPLVINVSIWLKDKDWQWFIFFSFHYKVYRK